MSERKVRAAILSALLAVCLLVPALLGLCACNDSDALPFEAEINALYSYRRSLEAEYSNVVETFREEYLVPVSANITLVYLDVSEQLWDAYAVLKEASLAVRTAAQAAEGVTDPTADDSPMLHVTLCLSENMLPGDAGCITREQFDLILDEGASVALYYSPSDGGEEGVAQLSEYIDRMAARLGERGISMPSALVFSSGSYVPELQEQYNELLLARGIPNILHYGEGVELEIIESGSSTELFRPGIVNWQTPQMQKFFVSDIMTLGGCAAYAFSFTDMGTELHLDLSNAAYQRMLVYISEQVISGKLNSCPFDVAWDKLIEYHTSIDSLADAIDSEKDRLRNEIRDVDGLIGRLSSVKDAAGADRTLLRRAYSIRLAMLEGELSNKLHAAYEALELPDRANVGLLFDSLADGVYDAVTKHIVDPDGKLKAGVTLCLSADSLPGTEGCMTSEELDELLALGCDTAIYFDGDGIQALGDELSALSAALAESDIAMPSTLVLADGSFADVISDSEAFSELLSEHGILGAVYSDAVTSVASDGGFTAPVLSWNEGFCRRQRILDTVRSDGALLLRLSLDGTDDGARFDPTDLRDAVMLENLLSNISFHISAGRLGSLPIGEYADHALAFDAEALIHAEQIGSSEGVARLRGLVEEYERRLAELG